MKEILSTEILTATVFAAVITSIANIVISIINNYQLKKLEKDNRLNAIDTYRYSRLYELILKWHEYDTPWKAKTPEKIASERMINLLLDDSGRYELARPLLNHRYVKKLDSLLEEGKALLEDLLSAEEKKITDSQKFVTVRELYFQKSIEFSNKLKSSINEQLEELLAKSCKG